MIDRFGNDIYMIEKSAVIKLVCYDTGAEHTKIRVKTLDGKDFEFPTIPDG